MKKLSCSLLLILTAALIFSFIGTAETFDVSSLTDNELLELNDIVHEEIVERGLNNLSILPTGAYTVGDDIEAGCYKLTGKDGPAVMKILIFSGDDYSAYVANGCIEKNSGANPTVILLSQGDEGFIGIKDGEVLVTFYPCYIEEANESWMP